MRRPAIERRAVAAALISALSLAAPAQAAPLEFKRCGQYGFSCARLSVPLDRTGALPGRVSLLVKRRRALERPHRGALVVLAGGPGQSATGVFDGENAGVVSAAQDNRDLIVYDQRGTGRSGLLRCLPLERANIRDPGAAAAECARRLGPRRAFYTSRDSADDLEAIRVALGLPKLSLYGVSYGTWTAQAYALRYPDRVDRLVLDSVVGPEGPDSLGRDTFTAVPRVLRLLCGRACRSFTADPAADIELLVDRIAKGGPLRGRLPDFRGRPRPVSIDQGDLFQVLISGDFVPQLRLAFPGAAAAARDGDLAPLLRLKRRSDSIQGGAADPLDQSPTLYAATNCEEARLPWSRTTPLAERPPEARAFVEGLPESEFDPFDRATALASEYIELCLRWPQSPVSPVPGPGPLPDVPALLIEGEDDLRTPVESARRVAARMPQSKLVVVPGVGHSALAPSTPGCAGDAFERFFGSGEIVERCPRAARRRPPAPPAATLADVKPSRPGSGVPGRAAAAAALTLADVREDSQANVLRGGRVLGGGLRGGRYSLTGGPFSENRVLRLHDLSFVGGLRLSGRVSRFGTSRAYGAVRLRGPRGARGLLEVRGRRLTGSVGGRTVAAP